MTLIDAATLRQQIPISSVIGQTVPLKREGRFLKGCCPFHADRSPSFYASDQDGRFWCMGCGAKGDIFDFVMEREGVRFPQAAEIIGAGDYSRTQFPAVAKGSKATDTQRQAREIWETALPIEGTLAERYLEYRGLPLQSLPSSTPLRFDHLRHPETKKRHPALISPVRNLSGELTGIQRTYLSADGSKLGGVTAKLSLGRIRGSATRLGDSLENLVLCEGLEDGLTLWRALPSISVWVAAGASNLARIELPQGCREVVLAADNDEAGRQAADAAAHVFQQLGKLTRIMRPSPQFRDFNQQLQKDQSA